MQRHVVGLTRREMLKVVTTGLGATLLMGAGLFRWRTAGRSAVVRQARPMLGTVVAITAHHPDAEDAARALDAAFAAIAHVDRVMSIHRADSDITRVNRAAGDDMIPVDPALLDVVALATAVQPYTAGRYDITCLPLMRLYGFYARDDERHHYPSDRTIAAALEAIGSQHIRLDPAGRRMGLAKRGGGIDLGSIGKGYAVDRAAAVLRNHGIANAFIDIGGNVLGLGTPAEGPGAGEGWRVAIRNPQGDGADPYFETVTLRDCAVATSGNYEQRVRLDDREVGHLFDMRRGRPVEWGLSATVVAKTAALADALSTSAFLLGTEAPSRLHRIAREIYLHGFSA